MADRRILLPEVAPVRRLGRHINHDPRSLQYKVGRTATPKTVRWERVIPILDQGNVGSCTGNATLGVLGTEPFYSTLKDAGVDWTQAAAVAIYSAATKIDPFPGAWEPDDSGSDGLSVAKVAKSRGFISGYRHVTSLGEAHAAIQDGPFITGTYWQTGMFYPDREGIVRATGTDAGGHEYEVLGYDAARDLWEFVNSWGNWAKGGHFYMDTPTYSGLLARQGDATPFVPITAPAPEPTPAPAAPFPIELVQPWLDKPRSWKRSIPAAEAVRNWLAQQ